MLSKRVGLITVGAAAGMVAAAPLAWAGGTGYDDADVKGAHKDNGGHSTHHDSGKACAFDGGDAAAGSEITGNALANVVAQAPIAGNNIANIANCSDFLNNNLNGNLSDNEIAVLGGGLPAAPVG